MTDQMIGFFIHTNVNYKLLTYFLLVSEAKLSG